MENVGEFIKTARESKGVTLTWLAEKIGLSLSYLSTLERGGRDYPVRILDDIAWALDISFLDLMSRAGYLDGAKKTEVDLLLENEELKRKLAAIKEILK